MEVVTRGAFRSQLTKVIKAANEHLNAEDSQINDKNVERFDAVEEELVTLIDRLTAVHASVRTADQQIAAKELIKSSEHEKESEKIAEYDDTAVSTLARLKFRLQKLRRNQQQPRSSPLESESSKSNTKLPKLQLKTFDGEMRDWVPFWDQFDGAVNQNDKLSTVEKFQYLEGALRGEAKKVIAGFTASTACYDAAVALLKEQYGDTEKLVDGHMQKLITLRPITAKTDVVGLRNLYNTISTSVRSLTALHVPSQQYDVMLKSILLRCLPVELRVDYHRAKERDDSASADISDDAQTQSQAQGSLYGMNDNHIKSIMQFLKSEVEALERSKVTPLHTNTKVITSTSSPTTAASLVRVNAAGECVFCHSSKHMTKDCDDSKSMQQKREILRKTNRCFRCAKIGHSSRKCRSLRFLKCAKCGGKHLSSLCEPAQEKAKSTANMVVPTEMCASKCDKESEGFNMCVHSSYTNVFLKTALCVAIGADNNSLIRVVIDGGSQQSYVRESVAKKLNLLRSSEKVRISVIPFGSKEKSPMQTYTKVKIKLKSQYDERCALIEAIVVPEICVDVLQAPDSLCPSFKNLRLADTTYINLPMEQGLSMLIGSDFYWAVVTGKQRRISLRLRGIETVFGWTLQGFHSTADAISSENITAVVGNVLSTMGSSDLDLSALWSLESIGIRGEEAEKQNVTEKLTSQCLIKKGDRYEATLPWKDPKAIFGSNRNQAVIRLNSLIHRLSRDPVRLKEYDAGIKQLIIDGVAEPVKDLSEVAAKRVIYLPHRPVYKDESTTTKLRIVFDASSRTDAIPSLNDQLVTGTNLLPDVLKILLNFRLGRIGIVADIEKAFLQIMLKEDDRDSHRFLWTSSLDTENRPRDYQEFRMKRVTFGVNCSPFLLTGTIRHHLAKEKQMFPETCRILADSFYMDDLVLSVDSDDEGKQIHREAMEIMAAASMRLRKWHSNSRAVRDATKLEIFPTCQKVLGLNWLVFSDELAVQLESVQRFLEANLSRGSKRNVLSAMARVYDPLGIVSPTIIKLKILFQSTWRRKLAWDDVLPPDLLLEWNDCVQNILQLKDMAVPRSALSLSSCQLQCHIFADASLKAYGAAAYIRAVDSSGVVAVSFLCAKSRIAPLKEDGVEELTLPKLELTAALIASRLCSYLKQTIKISVEKYLLWTDSKITLSWIFGQMQRWKPYVQSRVVEIRRHTSISDWNHCSGKDNPADLITRGISGEKLKSSLLWAQGPKWLSDAAFEDQHPNTEFRIKLLTTMLVETDVQELQTNVPVLCCDDFSSWSRLLRVTSWVLRFVKHCRTKQRLSHCFLTETELREAEGYWLRYVQSIYFSNDIRCLQKKKPLMPSSKIVEFHPFLDDGLLRLGGRLQLLDDTFDVIHPIILPSNHHLVSLIIDDYHLNTIHGGVNTILSKVRERFWVIKARQLVKRRVKSCITCRKLFGQPASQPFAPLPLQRITLTRPFDNVGIDFAGPLYYLASGDTSMCKAYILIFTCAAIRAIHLELTTSVSTDSCIMALRRFMARRGVPSVIFSDNAKIFRRASLELKGVEGIFEGEALQGFLCQKRIKWEFIVERAPWWGGFWERLIRTIKNTLKIVIGKAKLNFDQLRTILVEAEAIANERPLTYVSSEPMDLTPLTPAKLLYGSPQSSNTSKVNKVDDTNLREMWKHRMKYSAKLAKRWRCEYLQLLRSFHSSKDKTSNQLKRGDIVLLFDHATPRIHWKMIAIEKAYEGRDGKVRSCEVRCADSRLFRRPIQLLYPLELSI